MTSALRGKTIALAVSGSIAAYKAAVVARLCVQAGARVLPLMTRSAAQFLGPLTLAGLCGEPVATDMWDPNFAGEKHVALADKADAILLVPATADLLARLAAGRADDLVTALVLGARHVPILAAPAMHPRMWGHPATQKNVSQLSQQGRLTLVGPVFGGVASGDLGVGRMSEPEDIVRALEAALASPDLEGKRVVVTAGPTFEDVDPVRFLGNRSSGKMGFALATRAALRGAQVTLIAGPVERSRGDGALPGRVTRRDVRSALEMRAALWETLGGDLTLADALIMAAAVADYRPREASAIKVKKAGEDLSLALVRNPDLLAEIGAAREALGKRAPVLVGFALETMSGEGLVDYARGKLRAKRVDLVVANEARVSLGADDNAVTLVEHDSAEALPVLDKLALADLILDRIVGLASRG